MNPDLKQTLRKHSAGGVILRDGKVLVIFSASRNSVGFPKGVIDKGETPEQAAIREVKEETGYDVNIHEKIEDTTYEFKYPDGRPCIKTVSYYLMTVANDDEPAPNLQPGEDFTTEWLTPAKALEQLSFDSSKDILKRVIGTIE